MLIMFALTSQCKVIIWWWEMASQLSIYHTSVMMMPGAHLPGMEMKVGEE